MRRAEYSTSAPEGTDAPSTFRRKGLEVVGIDNSPLAVKVCKLRGLKNVRVMSISEVGPQLGRSDTVLMIGNNFGLFGGFKQARRLLRRFHGLTSVSATMMAGE